MSPTNEPICSASGQKVSLSEDLIKAAKEVSRRHGDLAKELQGGWVPKIADFYFQSSEQAKAVECLFFQIYLELRREGMWEIKKHFEMRLRDLPTISFLILDFIENQGKQVGYPFPSRTKLDELWQSLLATKSKEDEILRSFKQVAFQPGIDFTATWSQANAIDVIATGLMDELTSLITQSGLRQRSLPFIEKAGVHRSILIYILEHRLKVRPTVADVASQLYSNVFDVKILWHSPVARNGCKLQVLFELVFDHNWLPGFCKKFAEILDPACPYFVSLAELDLASKYRELFSRFVPQNCGLLAASSFPPPQVLDLQQHFRNFILAQGEFFKRMRIAANEAITSQAERPTLGQFVNEQPINMPTITLTDIHQEVKAVRAENQEGIKKIQETIGGVTQKPVEPIDDDHARNLIGLISKFESGSRLKQPSVTAVFRLYCVENLTADDIAKKCRCSKGTVVNRLSRIRRATGRDPAELRAYSTQFQKVEDQASDPRAKRIHRESMLDASEYADDP